MSIHKEKAFEDLICAHLSAHAWAYQDGPNSAYDRALALHLPDLQAWVSTTQPEAWAALERMHGDKAIAALGARLRDAANKQGLLMLLRDGLDVLGLRVRLFLCRFKPALAMNADLQAQYGSNRLRVMRQVRYSVPDDGVLDLVLLLNGIPVATVELKSSYTQNVQDAIDQYRYDRPVRSSKNTAEPLLSFPGGAFVHFAVSNAEVRMCTLLEGAKSVFLPFNRGHDGGAGNGPNPNGAQTAYLWEEIWDRDSWLEVLGRYIIPVRDDAKRLKSWVFPRFHQLDATRSLVRTVRAEGAGGRYLVQHSAGSGKTNSIAWTAHFLADLHDDAGTKKIFDTVLVVSDRTVLDKQLKDAILAFERTEGVVAVITGDGGSKSKDLADALEEGKKIVVCTIQTFPFALDRVRELAATKGKRFAVIADEAHSSQSGQAAADLRMVLAADVDGEPEELSTEDILAARMRHRAEAANHISFLAFTATPKAKTVELFGTLPDPSRPAGKDNLPRPFHVYPMRQAIEEGFILDVLKNYTTYRMALRLTHDGRERDEREVEADEARKRIMGWVRLHPHNIQARVQIVVEHFRDNVAHLLAGKAKAMVVTSSRLEAVRWALAMRKYISAKRYPIGLLVAFSGDVSDPESGPGPFNEISMNMDLDGREIPTAFATDAYSILLVANKFQTGFDQPLLSAMYVDRQLGGVQAVQTLSRLNRSYPGKDATYVVDFVNDAEEMLAAFKQYHDTAELADVSNPNAVLDLRAKLDATGLYDAAVVALVAGVVVTPGASQARLDALLSPVCIKLLTCFREARESMRNARPTSRSHTQARGEMDALLQFKGDLGAYVRAYEFLSQIFDYGNTYFEKLHIFAKLLHPLLNFAREREGIDLSALDLTHISMRDLGQHKMNLGAGEAEPLKPLTEVGTGQPQDKSKATLSAIVQAVNDLFEGEISEGDAVAYVGSVIKNKMVENESLRAQAKANTREQFANSPDLKASLIDAILDAMSAHEAMSNQALDSDEIRARILSTLLGPGELWESLRG